MNETTFDAEFTKAKEWLDAQADKLTPAWRNRLFYGGAGLALGGVGGVLLPMAGLVAVGVALYSLNRTPDEPKV